MIFKELQRRAAICFGPVRVAAASTIAVVILTALVMSGCAGTGSRQSEEKPEPTAAATSVRLSKPMGEELNIKTEAIEKRNLATTLHVTGQINPQFGKEVSLATRVTGRVVQILTSPGQNVKAGQTLAVIDSQQISDLEGELIEAQSRLNIAREVEGRERQIYEEQLKRPKAFIEAKARFDEAKVQLELTELELKRLKSLFEERIAAEKDYYTARAHFNRAEAVYRQTMSDMQREERLFQNKSMMKRDYQLAMAETNHAQQRFNTLRQRLKFMGMTDEMVNRSCVTQKIGGTIPLVAPQAGIITQQTVALGEVVDPGKQAFLITDLTNVAISAEISEVDLPHITMGMPVKAKISGYPDEVFVGTISYIDSHVHTETRTATIRATVPNPDLKLKANMFAEVDIDLSPRMVLACPRGAVLEREAKKVVYVSTRSGYEERKVKLGQTNDKFYEIISGLAEGDKVVTAGSLLLKAELTSTH